MLMKSFIFLYWIWYFSYNINIPYKSMRITKSINSLMKDNIFLMENIAYNAKKFIIHDYK